ncbi:MAG: 30S ribosomal protein S20 [Patescibacteria group bacterium]
MPITQSAKKALRQNIRRQAMNLRRTKAMKEVVKKYRKMVASKQMDEAKKFLPSVYKTMDKTAKAGTIKKNTASRLKSRLARLVA